VKYIAIGCAILAVLAWLGRGKPIFKQREWRLLSGSAAIAAFATAAYVGIRGHWGSAIVLAVSGLWLMFSTRMVTEPAASSLREAMGESEARSILGVGPQATRAEVQAAYSRLMRMAHPDKGGTSGLAAQLNAARDRLLKG
jgi:hypothetical protein